MKPVVDRQVSPHRIVVRVHPAKLRKRGGWSARARSRHGPTHDWIARAVVSLRPTPYASAVVFESDGMSATVAVSRTGAVYGPTPAGIRVVVLIRIVPENEYVSARGCRARSDRVSSIVLNRPTTARRQK